MLPGPVELLSSGIPGLDALLQGGLVRGAAVLVEGVPGAGKTTLGTQFIYHGITVCDEPGLIVTFEEFPTEILRDAAGFGWDLAALESADKLRIVSTSPNVFAHELMEPGGMLDQVMAEVGPRRALVDSVSLLTQVTHDAAALRQVIYGLRNGLRRLGLTALLTKEVESADPREVPFEEYVADTVIRLAYRLDEDTGERRRELEITKSRTRPHLGGRHLLTLTGQGIVIYPPPAVAAPAPPVGNELAMVSSGCAGLDRMLGGGLIRGSSTIVAGSTGVGKTVLGLQFLFAGVEAGETGLMVSFEQSPADLARAARSLGWPAEHLAPGGAIQVYHAAGTATPLVVIASELALLVAEQRPTRIVLDAISTVAKRPGIYDHDELPNLIGVLRGSGATLVICDETPGIVGEFEVTGGVLISSLVDNIIMMRYVELSSTMRRAVSVLKARCVDHDKEIREYVIGPGGVALHEKFEVGTGLLRGTPSRSEVDGFF